VKNGFQSLPFKCNLQRYFVGGDVIKQQLADGRVGRKTKASYGTSFDSYWLKVQTPLYNSQSCVSSSLLTPLICTGAFHHVILQSKHGSGSIDDSR
jgi:hypothetical protein